MAEDSWFPRPAIDISGTLVGYAVFSGEGAEIGGVDVLVDDLTKRPHAPLLDLGLGPQKVGSLRLKANGSIAWIECPTPENHPENASPRPNCVRPGQSVNSVYKRDTTTNTKDPDARDLLDQGAGIDPRSLHLHGSTLSWNHSGKRHTAVLH